MLLEKTRERLRSGASLARLAGLLLVAGTLFNHRALIEPGGRGSSDLRSAIESAAYDPSEGLQLLGLILFVVLVFFRRDSIRAAFGRPGSWVLGVPALLSGGVLLVWARQIAAPDLLMPALVLHLVGLGLILGGTELLRAIGMPLMALVVAIPLPGILINQIVFPMQLITVSLTSTLLDLAGRSHVVAGDLIVTNGIVFQVIEGCSGLKTALSLLLAAVALADLTARSGREKAILIVAAPFVGILVNGLRVLALVLREVPPESDEHTLVGLMTTVVGVVLLVGIERLLARTPFAGRRHQDGGQRERSTGTPSTDAAPTRRLVALAGGAVLLSALLSVFPLGSPFAGGPPARNIEALPLEIDGWHARNLRFDNALFGSVWFRHRIYRSYEKDGREIRVFIGLADDLRRDRSSYSAKTSIPTSGWQVIERNAVSDEQGHVFERLLIRYRDRSVQVEHHRVGYAPWGLEILSAWSGLDRRCFGGASNAFVIRIETDRPPGDRTDEEPNLRQFSRKVVDWVRTPG